MGYAFATTEREVSLPPGAETDLPKHQAPTLVSCLLYNGKRDWTAPLSIHGAPAEAAPAELDAWLDQVLDTPGLDTMFSGEP